ncbi:MAG TPA: NAD(P)/FAD-dependent oxidoreductase [Mycobacterium sp.]|nr:NAD(P)/FAD-dependent oxidoreductase [Mycobacterium sp.]
MQTTEKTDADVIIVGAGFAGATAARDLTGLGHSVLIVEGRDRIGGRVHYRPYADTGMLLEMGGTWVNPRFQRHIAAELSRYDTETFASPTPEAYAWGLQGEVLHTTIPLPASEWSDLERVLAGISQAAQRVRFLDAPMGQPGLEDLDVPLSEWLDGFALPPRTRDFVMAWPSFYMGVAPSEVSALHFLTWTAGFNNSAVAYLTELTDKVKGGTVGLVEKMIAESGAALHLETAVAAVIDEQSSVRVRTTSGDELRSRGVIVTAPVNTWHSIDFEPALSGAYQAMADERQPAHTIKVWLLVRGLTENFFGVGNTTVFKWIASEYATVDGTYMVGFALPDELDPRDTAAVTRAVHEFLPDVEVVSVDFHDWNGDPFSQGTWMAYRPGQITRNTPGFLQPHGRVLFAGSDVAHGWAGWIDGAIESGGRAAQQLHRQLADAPAKEPIR